MRKKGIILAGAAVAVVIVLTAGYFWKENHTVSPEAVKVIHVMMTCPNKKYYSPKEVTILGEGAPVLTKAQKQEQKELEKKLNANWKRAVGACFESDFRFERFLSSSVPLKYLSMEKPVTVKKIVLAGTNKTNGTQTVDVTVSVDGKESVVPIIFTYGDNGKIRLVRYQ